MSSASWRDYRFNFCGTALSCVGRFANARAQALRSLTLASLPEPGGSECKIKTTIMGNRGQGSLGGLGSYPPLARFHPLFAGGSHAPLRNILFLHAHYKGPRRTLVPPVSVSLVAARPIRNDSLSMVGDTAHRGDNH